MIKFWFCTQTPVLVSGAILDWHNQATRFYN